MRRLLLAFLLLAGCGGETATTSSPAAKPARKLEILNVSYDPTRELYQQVNAAFAKRWSAEHNETLTIHQSHGGSGKQARAVIDGLEADVVTLALAWDVDAISAKAKLLPANWQTRLPHNSCPYTSTIVFLVRKGNPKQIRDWSDLAKPGVSVVTPNPKTSGGARWNYLAAWGSVLWNESNGDLTRLADASFRSAADAKARDLVQRLFANVAVLDTGARGATMTFVQRKIGDVLIAWENEALLTAKTVAPGEVEVIVPPVSILAEPPVAWIDTVADRKGTRQVAEAYLRFLYEPEAQQLIASHHYRPADARQRASFPQLPLFTIDAMFGGWDKAQQAHFSDGGVFDAITTANGKGR
ncbi:MAG TPA: sulfate ABC transporter substrate-binding protein [Thermoanaerobaculia bacterium]|jgi:sulfate transport system substrate-binding protein